MDKLRFAVFGAGFWANYQIAAWKELEGIELVAIYNRNLSKAEAMASAFNIPKAYNNAEELLDKEKPGFIDIITDVNTHPLFTQIAAERGIDVISQKPMAPSLKQAEQMVANCHKAEVKFFVHENFRWQAPLRALKNAITSGVIGKPFKAGVSFCSSFPVFENQPFLADLEQFILTDVGSHILDMCRFLFGEARSLYCLTSSVNPRIKGEDVANVFLEMENGLHCYAEMSYASILEKESFPQTLVSVEGENGSIQITHDFELKITTRQGTTSQIIKPVMYSWIDPAYAVVHSSIVDCNRDILNGLQGGLSETTGQDNLRTIQLVYAGYQSAATGKAIVF